MESDEGAERIEGVEGVAGRRNIRGQQGVPKEAPIDPDGTGEVGWKQEASLWSGSQVVEFAFNLEGLDYILDGEIEACLGVRRCGVCGGGWLIIAERLAEGREERCGGGEGGGR